MAELTGTTRLAGVIGAPVRHSLSPVVHNAAFAAVGFDAAYVALEVAEGRGADAVGAMRLFDLLGLSVTMPHKHDVVSACDMLTSSAGALGAVNCLFWSAGRLAGDNTDGTGLVRGLQGELGVDIDGRDCLVAGAGGAARAAVLALAGAGAATVTVLNRTVERAHVAAELAGPRGRVGSADDLAHAHLVVNATSVGMASTPTASEVPLDVDAMAADAVLVDLIYHPLETPLLAAARSRGVAHQNGVAMLVYQAATQFEHWTGLDAPIETMMTAARRAIGSTS